MGLCACLALSEWRAHAQPTITSLSPATPVAAGLGSKIDLTVTAAGKGRLTYQWRHNGFPILSGGGQQSIYSIPSFEQPDGGRYDVVVTDDGGYAVSASIDLILASLAPPVFNTLFIAPALIQFTDNFQDSQRAFISASSGLASFSNVEASREPGEPLHAGKTGQSSVWMTWIAPVVPGIAHFDTRGSGFDTVLAVYQGTKGTSLAGLTRIASDDDILYAAIDCAFSNV